MLEALGKVERIGKTRFGGDGRHRLLGEVEKQARARHALHLQKLMGRLPNLFPKKMRQTGNGKAATLRESIKGHGLRQVLAEIIHGPKHARVHARLFRLWIDSVAEQEDFFERIHGQHFTLALRSHVESVCFHQLPNDPIP